jgi:hypothetical protein
MTLAPGRESELTQKIMIRLRLTSLAPWLLDRSDPRFLDAIDAALQWTAWKYRDLGDEHDELPTDLERILRDANSVWRVSETFDGLEERVNETATAAVLQAIRSANDEAADHLHTAWESTYGRDRKPDTAYGESVLAVEAVANPLVSPKNNQGTLGTIIRDLRNQLNKWELVLKDNSGQPASIEALLSMLTLLWQGQSRHAGSPNSRRQTQEEAEAAFHLAATLVQWLSTGVVVRKK